MTRVIQRLERLRPRPERFTSPLHGERAAAILGIALGVSFSVCFLTGLLSHAIQHPPSWFSYPTRPAGLYRVTQGLHVATGLSAIPILLAKLWVVYPRFWEWPPLRSVAHAIERISLLPLVGGGLFMLVTGTINIARWYSPMPFFFTAAHYWTAWITIGALVVHIGAKAATRQALVRHHAADIPAGSGLTRRGLLGTVAATSAIVTLATVGQTVRALRKVSVLGPRDPAVGPQGLPVNRDAVAAGVGERATDPGYRLTVEGGVSRPLSLSLQELQALPLHEAALPVTCVEGWSAMGRWRGVRVRDVLAAAGAPARSRVTVQSLEENSTYAASHLSRDQAADPDALLAFELNGEPLHLDHGFPVRLICPNRPGVLQTKWVHKLVVQ